jgi:pimeloyl-ACP methyl ester carboxylesterase
VRLPGDPRAPSILFFPGNSGTQLKDSQEFLEALIGDLDWGATVWAYRGFDGSEGIPEPEALRSDAWREYSILLDEEGVPRERVHLVGFSLGSVMASSVAARVKTTPPASVILLGAFTEVDVAPLREQASLMHRYGTLPYLDAMAGPVLVVHGVSDDTVPVAQGRLVAGRLGQRATYVELPRLGHRELLHRTESLHVLRAFVAEHSR